MKTVTLSEEHWEHILEAVLCYQDCGPTGQGWKSDEMQSAYDALDAALEAVPPTPTEKTPCFSTVKSEIRIQRRNNPDTGITESRFSDMPDEVFTDLDALFKHRGFPKEKANPQTP